tara:strand:+ start:162 stop:527 length:366 start_codon:yes stop_codon:yes gene_type:complete
MKKILITLVTLIGFILPQECEEPENVWFKISNNPEHMYGKLMTIDMSAGYALVDELGIYLIVLEKNTGEEIVIMFPFGYWEVGKVEKNIPKKKEKKEFDLDEYLKQNKGKGLIVTTTIGGR